MLITHTPAKHWVTKVALTLLLATAGCGRAMMPTNTLPTLPAALQVDPGKLTLPSAWIILGDQRTLGTLAAGGTSQGHFDPSPILPDIKPAVLSAASKIVIEIESNSVRNVTVTVRPWNRDGTIIPLVDSSARQLQIESQGVGSATLITLDAVANGSDQLLNANVAFKDGWGFYLWRLNPRE